MRALFLILVAANLALFAWTNTLAPPDAGSDPRPLAQQIEPQKLRILSPEELAGAPRPVPEACVEWGGVPAADVARAAQALEPLALGARLAQRRADEAAAWWVFIAPQGSRLAAQKKATELKALGVDEYFIVQDDGPARWALSLGVFRNEAAAKNHLAALQAKGVRTAQLAEREAAVSKTWFQVRNADAVLQARLKDIAQGFGGTEVRDCS